MKKIFLLMGACAIAMGAQAVVSETAPLGIIKKTPELRKSVQTRAAGESLTFGYCYDLYTYVGSGLAGSFDYEFIEIPEAQAMQWKDNYVSEVMVGFGQSSDPNVTVIITKDIMGEPLYTQEAKITRQEAWNTVKLDTPFLIDGSGFFIGWMAVNRTEDDYPMGVDYTYSENEYADIFMIKDSKGAVIETLHIGTMFGSNCIRLTIEGDNLPQNNAMPTYLDLPPFVTAGSPFNAVLYVQNNGVKTISSMEVSVKLNGQVVSNNGVTFPEGFIPSNQEGLAVINYLVPETEGANQVMEITVTKVNGVENEALENATITGYISAAEEGYERNVLIEEFTGTWCGWCPRGIVGMAYMEENYGDNGFVGVAVHYNDAMQSSSYVNISNAFSGGAYPSAVVDRTYYFDPAAETMEEYYEMERQFETFAKIDLTGYYTEGDNVVDVEGVAQFSMTLRNSNYRMAFALIENNVGPYMQTNNFSSPSAGYLEGWTGQPARVSTIYNEVGRVIVDPFGIAGSIPSNITKGQDYEYKTLVSTSNVKDIENCKLVGMILDADTYKVINSVKTNITFDSTGVESLDKDSKEILKVYNPQGVKVMETGNSSDLQNLPKGIYIINGKKVKL